MSNDTIDIVASFRSKRTIDDLSIVLVAVIWGSSYVVMQDVGRTVPAAEFLMLRFLSAVPPLAILAARTLSGILMLETVGVRHTSAANAGFLIALSVVLIPVLERVVSKRRQQGIVYLMAAIAVLGCGMLLLASGGHPQSGDFIIGAAALIRATQITLFGRRPGGADQSLINLSLIEFVVVAVLAGITAAASGTPMWQVAAAISSRDWLLIGYLGRLGTAIPFLAQLRAARAASSTRVGLILATEPVFAAVFAIVAAGNRLSLAQIAGGALIVVSAAVGRTFEGRAASSMSGYGTVPCVAGRDGSSCGPAAQAAARGTPDVGLWAGRAGGDQKGAFVGVEGGAGHPDDRDLRRAG